MKLGGREHLKQHVGVKLSPGSTECVSQLLLLREAGWMFHGGCLSQEHTHFPEISLS